jgi:hypothetical protein
MPRAHGRTDVSPGPAGSSQPEWTAIMCTHDPACPPSDAIDWWAARNITEHPAQGWTLLCNGALVFDDRGALLPDGRIAAISDVPDARLCTVA